MIWLAARAFPTHRAGQDGRLRRARVGLPRLLALLRAGTAGPPSRKARSRSKAAPPPTAPGTEAGRVLRLPGKQRQLREGALRSRRQARPEDRGQRQIRQALPLHRRNQVRRSGADARRSQLVDRRGDYSYDIDKFNGMGCNDKPGVLAPGTKLATLDTSGVAPTYSTDGKTISWTAVPATLTAAGAVPFEPDLQSRPATRSGDDQRGNRVSQARPQRARGDGGSRRRRGPRRAARHGQRRRGDDDPGAEWARGQVAAGERHPHRPAETGDGRPAAGRPPGRRRARRLGDDAAPPSRRHRAELPEREDPEPDQASPRPRQALAAERQAGRAGRRRLQAARREVPQHRPGRRQRRADRLAAAADPRRGRGDRRAARHGSPAPPRQRAEPRRRPGRAGAVRDALCPRLGADRGRRGHAGHDRERRWESGIERLPAAERRRPRAGDSPCRSPPAPPARSTSPARRSTGTCASPSSATSAPARAPASRAAPAPTRRCCCRAPRRRSATTFHFPFAEGWHDAGANPADPGRRHSGDRLRRRRPLPLQRPRNRPDHRRARDRDRRRPNRERSSP